MNAPGPLALKPVGIPASWKSQRTFRRSSPIHIPKIHLTSRRATIFRIGVSTSEVTILNLRRKWTFWPTPGPVGPPGLWPRVIPGHGSIFLGYVMTLIRWSNYCKPDSSSGILQDGASHLILHLMARWPTSLKGILLIHLHAIIGRRIWTTSYKSTRILVC